MITEGAGWGSTAQPAEARVRRAHRRGDAVSETTRVRKALRRIVYGDTAYD